MNDYKALPADELLTRMEALRDSVYTARDDLLAQWQPLIARETFQASARNLASYLALRQDDLRSLQLQLMPWGLSSLGRSESHVEETLDNVIATLRSAGQPRDPAGTRLTARLLSGR